MPTAQESQRNWAAYRSQIEDLYWHHKTKLPEVMKTMKEVHGFDANAKSYKRNFKAWGLEKNLKREESIAMLGIAERRRRMENKETIFYCRGKLVDPVKLRRFAKRHKLNDAGLTASLRAATPPNIRYRTPEPDTSKNLTTQPNLSCPEADRTEEELALVSDSLESCELNSYGNPQGVNIATVASSMPLPWPTDDQYSVSQCHHTAASRSTSQTHPNHRTLTTQKMFSQGAISPTLSQPSWPDYTEPPSEPSAHGDHASAAGESSRLFSQRLLQQAGNTLDDGLGYAISDLPNSYTLHVDYGVVESVPFGDTSPAYGATAASNMASASGYTTLHHAVIGNDIHAAEAMLCLGTSSNTPSCNGITPLHCAAYQRNPEMVRLLLDHGASLDATTDEKRSVLFFALRGHSQSDSSDLLIYGSPTMTRSSSPTDDETVRIIDALFNFPTRWNRLPCSLNKPDKAGVTPLMVAAGEGFVKTASWLLERGAQPDLRDHTDNTALKYAAKNYHRDMVRLLLLADKGISYERRPSHILKLASKNILMSQVQAEDEQGIWRNSYHTSPATLIAEEIVRLCREMGLLGELLDLAHRKRKVHLLELFQRAARELDRETSCSNGS